MEICFFIYFIQYFFICRHSDSTVSENTGIEPGLLRLRHWQYCGSGMFIPDPDFYPSRIPDFGSRIQKQQQKRGVKKICCYTFLCSHKFHKTENYFSFEVLKKKIWANFQRIIELFTKEIVTKLSKIWVWDPGVKKAPDPGSGPATLIYSKYRYRMIGKTEGKEDELSVN
jgi:hypothetical protein